jgi:uncharacterized repeat protein (TIGR03843 family)
VPALELNPGDVAAVLTRGALEVVGRLHYSSNGAFLLVARGDGVEIPAVYKPRRGERPLWDFPDGTLCQREVAAYEVSRALGWDIVPVTVMREDAPFGPGAVQRFVDHDPDDHYFTLLEHHEDRFREFAAFDVLVNNTDRKGGHCLYDRANDVVVGIDHGLTFHVAWKLRTVIWDFAGEPLPPALSDALCRLVTELKGGDLGNAIASGLTRAEVDETAARAEQLVRAGRFPIPDDGYRSVPWPHI